jgi:hypothetical protein
MNGSFTNTPKLAAAADERPVDAAAVQDEPASTLTLERAVAGASDEELWIWLKRDVIGIGKTADRHALARQRDVGQLGAIRREHDDLRSTLGL